MFETKTDKARRLILDGKTKDALRIVKKFDRRYSPDELRILQIAYECFSGNEQFYVNLGQDTANIKDKAIALLNKMTYL